jgi:hypothetical protein
MQIATISFNQGQSMVPFTREDQFVCHAWLLQLFPYEDSSEPVWESKRMHVTQFPDLIGRGSDSQFVEERLDISIQTGEHVLHERLAALFAAQNSLVVAGLGDDPVEKRQHVPRVDFIPSVPNRGLRKLLLRRRDQRAQRACFDELNDLALAILEEVFIQGLDTTICERV